MAESIKNQVDAITGFASTEDDALQDWCDTGAKEIINVLPPNLLAKCLTVSTLSNSPTTLTSLDTRGKIAAITRNDGTRNRSCREISSRQRGMVNDSSDLMNYATSTDPVYLVYNNTIEVYPVPTSNFNAYVEHTSYPTVDMTISAIANFPDEAQYLVVLFAASRAVQRQMSDKNANLSPLTITATPPTVPTITTVEFADYTTPTVTTSVVDSGVFSSDFPSYTSPSVSGDATDLTHTMQATTSGQTGTDAEFVEFDMWFTTVGEMIEDDEDLELAGAQLEKIKAYLQTYNMSMQDKLNDFNVTVAKFNALVAKANTDANARTQEFIQEANLESQHQAQKASETMQAIIQTNNINLTKYQAEVADYQARVGKEVQQYTNNMQKDTLDYTWYAQRYASIKSEYMTGLSMLVTGGLPTQGGGQQ